MKIKEYATDELLMMANNVSGEYTDKEVRQAKLELYRRGVSDTYLFYKDCINSKGKH